MPSLVSVLFGNQQIYTKYKYLYFCESFIVLHLVLRDMGVLRLIEQQIFAKRHTEKRKYKYFL